jgi:HEAT repeat protein
MNAVPQLIKLLNDKDSTVKENAAEALVKISPSSAKTAGVRIDN